MKVVLFIFVLLSQQAFALYGEKVSPSAEGFVVSLHLNDAEKSVNNFCAGVLISPRHVLTAGHCIDVTGLNVYGSSQFLIYNPAWIEVKAGSQKIRAKTITYARSYFEGTGIQAEDLALIELSAVVKGARPIKVLPFRELRPGAKVSLIAREKKVTTVLRAVKRSAHALILSSEGGACAGDSGGAVVVEKHGQQWLAGILMYEGEGRCEKRLGYAHYPRGEF